eukprot:s938_g22.t1
MGRHATPWAACAAQMRRVIRAGKRALTSQALLAPYTHTVLPPHLPLSLLPGAPRDHAAPAVHEKQFESSLDYDLAYHQSSHTCCVPSATSFSSLYPLYPLLPLKFPPHHSSRLVAELAFMRSTKLPPSRLKRSHCASASWLHCPDPLPPPPSIHASQVPNPFYRIRAGAEPREYTLLHALRGSFLHTPTKAQDALAQQCATLQRRSPPNRHCEARTSLPSTTSAPHRLIGCGDYPAHAHAQGCVHSARFSLPLPFADFCLSGPATLPQLFIRVTSVAATPVYAARPLNAVLLLRLGPHHSY